MISFFVGKKYKDGNYSDVLIGVIFIWVSLILYVYPDAKKFKNTFSEFLFKINTISDAIFSKYVTVILD